jgi:hypothetical protein
MADVSLQEVTRFCRVCKSNKPFAQFSTEKHRCTQCRKTYSREWARRNQDKVKAGQQRYKESLKLDPPKRLRLQRERKQRRAQVVATQVAMLGPDCTKTCSQCEHIRPLHDFSRLRVGLHGRHNVCRECHKARHHQTYQSLKAAGICTECKVSPSRPGRVQCEPCGVIASQRQRDLRCSLIAKGFCCQCCRKQQLPNAQYCERCYLRNVSFRYFRTREHGDALLRMLNEQKWRCAYTGEPLVLGVNDSLDHKNPRSRYPEQALGLDNLEWVTRLVNTTKGAQTKTEFLCLVEAIYTKLIRS